jgi:hypothetical protein
MFPTAIVEFLESTYTWLPDQPAPASPRNPGEVKALLSLLERVPDEFIQVSSKELVEYLVAKEQLAVGLTSEWRQFNGAEREAVRKIYQILKRCPDSAPPAEATEPQFITDPEFRKDLHNDIGQVNQSLRSGQHKAATVLAGAVVEAVLLWALQNKRTKSDIEAAATSLGKSVNLTSRPLESWYLPDLIEFAHATGLISPTAQAAATQAKDFRNLIHPGRAARLAKKCSHSTALLALGAVEAVIEELGG